MENQAIQRMVVSSPEPVPAISAIAASLERGCRVAHFGKAVDTAGPESACAMRLIRSSVPGSRLPSSAKGDL